MFPHTIDSTMLSTFRSCPQKMKLSYIDHWKPQSESVHLVAGAAFAKGVEVARRSFFEGRGLVPEVIYDSGTRSVRWHEESTPAGDHEVAQQLGLQALVAAYGDFQPPPDSAKSLERTAGALEFYYASYPFGADGATPLRFADGRRGIEFSFAEPLSVMHPVTGDPLLYSGRADMLAEYAGGNFVFDEKTASQLGASWPRQWELRSQFTGYIWAARRAGLAVQGAVVRGVSILKTKYDTLQSVTYRSPYEIERWEQQVVRDVTRMIQCWEEGYWDWNLDHACTEYSGCQFAAQVCKSNDPESWLPMYFEKRVWDPLARKEMSVEEYEQSWGHATASGVPGGEHGA